MAAIIQEDERAANEIIYKNCGKETVSFHPTQLLLLFDYVIGTDDDGNTVLQPMAIPINHNHIDTHKVYDITNNMSNDVMNIKPDKTPTMANDMMIYLVDYTYVSWSYIDRIFFPIQKKILSGNDITICECREFFLI